MQHQKVKLAPQKLLWLKVSGGISVYIFDILLSLELWLHTNWLAALSHGASTMPWSLKSAKLLKGDAFKVDGADAKAHIQTEKIWTAKKFKVRIIRFISPSQGMNQREIWP